jgi:TetR/AcrR family transcriptional regulator, transcriptional repressor of bet genes
MPKVGMEPIRRKQVINATLECISESGFEGLTLEFVAKKAGISKGVVSYYFKGKEDLILQSFRYFLEQYNQKVAEALGAEPSAMKMLDAMVDIVIFPESTPLESIGSENEFKDQELSETSITFTEEKYFSLLIHFYSRMKQNDKLQTIYQEIYQQYLDGIIEILKFGIENKEFKSVNLLPTAYGILAYMDGIILYEALGFQPLGKVEVKKAYRAHIRDILV